MVRLSTESRLAWGGWPRRLLAAAVATVMVTLGLVGTSSVAAAMTRTTYITPVYVYDAPALSSSPDNVASFTRGSPSGPGAGSWVSSVSVGDDGVAANTAPPRFITTGAGVTIDRADLLVAVRGWWGVRVGGDGV